MPGFADGLSQGAYFGATIAGIRDKRLDREAKEREALRQQGLTEQTIKVMGDYNTEISEQASGRQQALKLTQAMGQVAKMPKGPARKAQAKYIEDSMAAAGLKAMPPALSAILASEDPEFSVQTIEAMNRYVVDNPNIGMPQLKQILSDPELSAQTINQAVTAGQMAQVKKPPRMTARQRQIMIQQRKIEQINRPINQLTAIAGQGNAIAKAALERLTAQQKTWQEQLKTMRGDRQSLMSEEDLPSLQEQRDEQRNLLESETDPVLRDRAQERITEINEAINTKSKNIQRVQNKSESLAEKVLDEEFKNINEAADTARRMRGDLARFQSLLDAGELDTGSFAEIRTSLAGALEDLGYGELAKRITNIEQGQLARGLEARLTVTALNQAKLYPVSNVDLREVNKTVARLGNTEEANRFIIQSMNEVAYSDILRRNLYNQAFNEVTARGGTAAEIKARVTELEKPFNRPELIPFMLNKSNQPKWFGEFHQTLSSQGVGNEEIVDRWIKAREAMNRGQ